MKRGKRHAEPAPEKRYDWASVDRVRAPARSFIQAAPTIYPAREVPMTTPLQSAIFDAKLAEFYAEYTARNGTGPDPDVGVALSAPGLDLYFVMSVPGTFVPPATGTGDPGA